MADPCKSGGGSLDLQQVLVQFISDELLRGHGSVGLDEDLLSDGMINSLGMIRLIGFIEEVFGLHVPPEDFTIENFSSINVLANYLIGLRTDSGQDHDAA